MSTCNGKMQNQMPANALWVLTVKLKMCLRLCAFRPYLSKTFCTGKIAHSPSLTESFLGGARRKSKNCVAFWSGNSLLDGRDDAFEFCLIENITDWNGKWKAYTQTHILHVRQNKTKRWTVFRWRLFFVFFFVLFVCFPCYCLCLSILLSMYDSFGSIIENRMEIIDVRAANHKSFPD